MYIYVTDCRARCAGLDARAAAVVMRAVRNIVDTGRTVVTTIHQPSIDIFEVCGRCAPLGFLSKLASFMARCCCVQGSHRPLTFLHCDVAAAA